MHRDILLVHELTKNVDPEMIIYRGEETINKPNKSPCDIECYCNGKKDDTAYYITLIVLLIKKDITLHYITSSNRNGK